MIVSVSVYGELFLRQQQRCEDEQQEMEEVMVKLRARKNRSRGPGTRDVPEFEKEGERHVEDYCRDWAGAVLLQHLQDLVRHQMTPSAD